jgi:hypothetical protein
MLPHGVNRISDRYIIGEEHVLLTWAKDQLHEELATGFEGTVEELSLKYAKYESGRVYTLTAGPMRGVIVHEGLVDKVKNLEKVQKFLAGQADAPEGTTRYLIASD